MVSDLDSKGGLRKAVDNQLTLKKKTDIVEMGLMRTIELLVLQLNG